MEVVGWVLQEKESGKFLCHNQYIKDDEYNFNLINAEIFPVRSYAEEFSERINKMNGNTFYLIIPVNLSIK